MHKTKHEMKLQADSFNAMKTGKKTIEARLLDEKRSLVKIGDTIEFKNDSNHHQSLQTEVVGLLHYPNFETMFSEVTPLVFGFSTKRELLTQIEQFYSTEDQEKYGVVGIRIRLIV